MGNGQEQKINYSIGQQQMTKQNEARKTEKQVMGGRSEITMWSSDSSVPKEMRKISKYQHQRRENTEGQGPHGSSKRGLGLEGQELGPGGLSFPLGRSYHRPGAAGRWDRASGSTQKDITQAPGATYGSQPVCQPTNWLTGQPINQKYQSAGNQCSLFLTLAKRSLETFSRSL